MRTFLFLFVVILFYLFFFFFSFQSSLVKFDQQCMAWTLKKRLDETRYFMMIDSPPITAVVSSDLNSYLTRSH